MGYLKDIVYCTVAFLLKGLLYRNDFPLMNLSTERLCCWRIFDVDVVTAGESKVTGTFLQ